MNKYSDDPIKNELFFRMHRLMEEKCDAIRNGEKNLYSLAVHEIITQEYLYGLGYRKNDIIMPMPKGELEKGSKRPELKKYYSNCADYSWPRDTFYQYSFHECNHESGDILMYGYAMCGEELFPCAFWLNFLMTFKIPQLPGQLLPEEYAIDYMNLNSGKNIECYVGVKAPIEQTEEWVISRGKTIFPLEYIAQKESERASDEAESNKEILMGQQEMINSLSGENKERAIKWLMQTQ